MGTLPCCMIIQSKKRFCCLWQTLAAAIGQKILILRKERGITLGELAHRVGCSFSFISYVEREKVSRSIAILKQVANTRGVNVVDFFLPSDDLESVVTTEGGGQISMKRWKAKINLLVTSIQGKRTQPFYTDIKPGFYKWGNGGRLCGDPSYVVKRITHR